MINNISATNYLDIPEEVQLIICKYSSPSDLNKYRLLCKETFEIIEKNAAYLYSPDELKIKNYYAEYCNENRIFKDELEQLHTIKLCDLHSNMEVIIEKLKKQQEVVDVIISEKTYLFLYGKFIDSGLLLNDWRELQTPYSRHLIELFKSKPRNIDRMVKNIFKLRSHINILEFPEELQIEIYKFLPCSTLNNCRMVCKERFNFIEKNAKLIYTFQAFKIKNWFRDEYYPADRDYKIYNKMLSTLTEIIQENKKELCIKKEKYLSCSDKENEIEEITQKINRLTKDSCEIAVIYSRKNLARIEKLFIIGVFLSEQYPACNSKEDWEKVELPISRELKQTLFGSSFIKTAKEYFKPF